MNRGCLFLILFAFACANSQAPAPEPKVVSDPDIEIPQMIITLDEDDLPPVKLLPETILFPEGGFRLRTPGPEWDWEKYVQTGLMALMNHAVLTRSETGQEITLGVLRGEYSADVKILDAVHGLQRLLWRRKVVMERYDMHVNDKAYFVFFPFRYKELDSPRVGWAVVANIHTLPDTLFVVTSTAPTGMEEDVRRAALEVLHSIETLNGPLDEGEKE